MMPTENIAASISANSGESDASPSGIDRKFVHFIEQKYLRIGFQFLFTMNSKLKWNDLLFREKIV